MSTLKNINNNDIRALINATYMLSEIQKLSEIDIARIEERILGYFQYYENNRLFKNKNAFMFLSLPYEIQQSILKMEDTMKQKDTITDNKIISFAKICRK